jgi:hypothetical protein
MAELTEANPFGLDPRWRKTVDRIIKMMVTGIAPDELEPGPASTVGIERYARAVCDANPQSDLGVMYGLISVATCVAAQGAYVLKVPIAGGGWLIVPAIQYFIGIAPSGWRKSTALNVARRPLKVAIEHGEALRRKQLPRLRDLSERDAAARIPANRTIDPKQFVKVYNAGFCPVTLVKDPTVEGTRDMLVANGGCAAVMAGEPDVFRNVGAYAPDKAGSLSFILDGFEQDDVATMRVGRGMLRMDEAALYMAVLMQTDVFADVTSGTGGGDSYQQRGMFGRFLIREATKTDGWAEAAAAYADDVEWDLTDDSDGMTDKYGQTSLLGLALKSYRESLIYLVSESNEYRLHKALRHAWLLAVGEWGNDLQVPEIEQLPRTELTLDKEALVEYGRIQRMQHALQQALLEQDEDVQSLWDPLISRFVTHVLREALTVTLGSGKRVVTAEIIRDAALRITPWRWGHSAKALVRRNTERVDSIIAQSFSDNHRQADLDPEAKVLAVLVKMAVEAPGRREGGWTAREIVRRATSTINRKDQKGVGPRLRDALDNLERDIDSGVTKVPSGKTPAGELKYSYVVSSATVENNRRG